MRSFYQTQNGQVMTISLPPGH